jgi:NAD(P)-dependent dehydrogenase (short-subunit alcohol dehydrogenase family)
MSTIVITGANRGIGLALARGYVAAGDRVIAACRAPDEAADLKALAESSSGRVAIRRIDIGDPASITAFSATVDEPVDILINNAGISGGDHQSLGDIDYGDWTNAFEVMTYGPLRLVTALLPQLGQSAGARIMTVSSQIGANVWPMGGYYIYGAAKAASNRVMQSLAHDLKPRGIAVGSIHPGWVQTDMGGAGAEIPAQESADGIRKVIAGLSLENTARFWKWNGKEHAF